MVLCSPSVSFCMAARPNLVGHPLAVTSGRTALFLGFCPTQIQALDRLRQRVPSGKFPGMKVIIMKTNKWITTLLTVTGLLGLGAWGTGPVAYGDETVKEREVTRERVVTKETTPFPEEKV